MQPDSGGPSKPNIMRPRSTLKKPNSGPPTLPTKQRPQSTSTTTKKVMSPRGTLPGVAGGQKPKKFATPSVPPSLKQNVTMTPAKSAKVAKKGAGTGLPKKPAPESTPPPDVQEARQDQTAALFRRQQRETQGKIQGAPRDTDAGTGYWPPQTPLL